MGVPRALGYAAAVALASIASGAAAQTNSTTRCFTVGGVVTCNTRTEDAPAPINQNRAMQQGRDLVPEYRPTPRAPVAEQAPVPPPIRTYPMSFVNIQTADDLLQACDGGSAQCIPFMSGAVGGYSTAYEVAGLPSRICAPPTMKWGEVQDMVVAELHRSPEHRHWPAAAFVVHTLIRAFPCGE